MSGIAGIFHVDGQEASAEDLRLMARSLARRGPDGEGVWLSGCVGLAHRMFWETPESLRETQPLCDAQMRCAVTADARLDNREELFHLLGLNGVNSVDWPDSRLILAAYGRWGEGCAQRLLGDFAFTLWDGRQGSLFCARDCFGVKPFYYSHRNHRFLFASELRGILCLPEEARELNEEMIADYLAVCIEDPVLTFYKGIERLPPAHILRVDAAGLHLHRYWQPDPERELRLKSDAEYAEVFGEAFSRAIQCRLRSAFPVASTLSGGLDSSSITCTARNLLQNERQGSTLKTFSAVFNDLPEVDESQYIRTVLRAGGIESFLVPMDDLGPLRTYREGLLYEEYPYIGASYYLHWGLHRAMREQEVRIVLDGYGGDDVVNHGEFLLTELATSFRWIPLLKECRECAQMDGPSISQLLWHFALRPVVPEPLLCLWRRLRHGSTPVTALADLPIAPGLLRRTGVRGRVRRCARAAREPRTLRQAHCQDLKNGDAFTFEAYDKLSYGHGLVTRYPFFDRRVAELSVAMPPQQKLHADWTRMILRRAMEGILPAEVQWRPDKSNLMPHFVRFVLGEERQALLQAMDRASDLLAPYVDLERLRQCCAGFFAGSQGVKRYWGAVWPVATLAVWLLEKAGDAQVPSVPDGSESRIGHPPVPQPLGV